MASREERLKYLHHHLSYELLMLRHTHQRLHETKNKLDWNAQLEAFAVHARNFALFLLNDKDSRNFRANDYITGGFVAKNPPVNIVSGVSVYVTHTAKARSEDPEKKFNLEKVDMAFAWIEESFAKFIEALEEKDREYWVPALADPSLYDAASETSVPIACTHPTAISLNLSNLTHTSHLEEFTFEFPKV
jgi:hypothetical protein